MERRLQLLTHVAFLLLLSIGIALGIKVLLQPASTESTETTRIGQPVQPSFYKPGEIVSIANLDFSNSEQTLVLVTRQGCKYCDESMPFYARLGADGTIKAKNRIVLVAPDSESSTRRELAGHGVRVDAIVSVPLRSLKIRGTPTAIVVNRDGQVVSVFPGLLDEERQERLLEALRSPQQP